MKNIPLLLVLIAGLVSGYFVGDYRGNKARIALEETIKTGQLVDEELRAANAQLKTELAVVGDKYKKDIEELHSEYDDHSAEWQRVKRGLGDTINRQNSKLVELNQSLDDLIVKVGRSDGAEKVLLEQKIAILRIDIDHLLSESRGNTCLKQQVPYSVIDALNNANLPRGK